MTLAAIFASDVPVAFDRYGTVRDARGFTSSTYTTSSLVANCTFISPTTPSARAMRRVCSRIVCRWRSGQRNGGTTHELSPEWMPASSMCSMMPPMITAPVLSATASTSNSNASSRNRSTSTGCSGDASTACVM